MREDNTNAIALYRKIGFVEEELRRNVVRLDGNYENVAAMTLLFEGLLMIRIPLEAEVI